MFRLSTSLLALGAIAMSPGAGCAQNKAPVEVGAVPTGAVPTGAVPTGAVQNAPTAPQPREPEMPLAEVGRIAPNFTLQGLDGETFTLANHRGETVVLEWFNPGCPFVQYAHRQRGPLELRPGVWIQKGVVWVAINSGADGQEGADPALNKKAKTSWGMSYPVLMDSTGRVGHMYGAISTPHMFVVDPSGRLAFAGALDNAPMGNRQESEPVNHVDVALEAVQAGDKVSPATTRPYGCSVSYAH